MLINQSGQSRVKKHQSKSGHVSIKFQNILKDPDIS